MGGKTLLGGVERDNGGQTDRGCVLCESGRGLRVWRDPAEKKMKNIARKAKGAAPESASAPEGN